MNTGIATTVTASTIRFFTPFAPTRLKPAPSTSAANRKMPTPACRNPPYTPIAKNSGTSTQSRGARGDACSAIQRSGFSIMMASITSISTPITLRIIR